MPFWPPPFFLSVRVLQSTGVRRENKRRKRKRKVEPPLRTGAVPIWEDVDERRDVLIWNFCKNPFLGFPGHANQLLLVSTITVRHGAQRVVSSSFVSGGSACCPRNKARMHRGRHPTTTGCLPMRGLRHPFLTVLYKSRMLDEVRGRGRGCLFWNFCPSPKLDASPFSSIILSLGKSHFCIHLQTTAPPLRLTSVQTDKPPVYVCALGCDKGVRRPSNPLSALSVVPFCHFEPTKCFHTSRITSKCLASLATVHPDSSNLQPHIRVLCT
jgi:hypothetical protein